LILGALAAAAVGRVWRNSVAGCAGAGDPGVVDGRNFVGAIPGWLRARRGSHEVITTIMLNFVAAGLASYVTLIFLKNPDSQNPETRPIGAGYLIHQFGFFGDAPVSIALPVAIMAAMQCDFTLAHDAGLKFALGKAKPPPAGGD